MSSRVVLLTAALLVACGSDDDKEQARARTATAPATAVTGRLDLERPPPGAPDAGTAGGHRAPDAVARTRASTFRFHGRLQPPEALIWMRHRGGGRVLMQEDGRFTIELRGLRPGANRVVLEGRLRGLRRWRAEVSVTRTR